MRLLFSSLAYILVEYIRKTGLKNTDLASARYDTIRLKLFKIGAIIIANTRKIALRMPTAFPYKETYITTVDNLSCGLG